MPARTTSFSAYSCSALHVSANSSKKGSPSSASAMTCTTSLPRREPTWLTWKIGPKRKGSPGNVVRRRCFNRKIQSMGAPFLARFLREKWGFLILDFLRSPRALCGELKLHPDQSRDPQRNRNPRSRLPDRKRHHHARLLPALA